MSPNPRREVKKSSAVSLGLGASLLTLGISACGGSGSDDDTTDETPASETSTVVSGGGSPTSTATSKKLTELYPVDLGLSFFPTSNATSLLLQDQVQDGTSAGESLSKKRADAEKRLKGDGDCMPPNLGKKPPGEGSEKCYEFDQDMIYATLDGSTYSGTLDGKNAQGEACLPAFARSRVDQVADMVDRATGMIQAMFCQAKKLDPGLTLPQKGQSVSLIPALKEAFGNKAGKITSAKMSREASDDLSGNPIYVSEVEMTDMNKQTRIVALVHSPKADGDYAGTLINAVYQNESNQAGWDKEKIHYITVSYSKTTTDGKSLLNYEARSARIHSDISDVFTDDGDLNFNAGANFSGDSTLSSYGSFKKSDGTAFAQTNDAISSIIYVAAQVNPSDNSGTFLYSQNPGGNYHEAARGMVASLSVDGAGVLGGCALSGAAFTSQGQGISIRKSLKEGLALDPTGFYHPFFNNLTAGNVPAPTSGSDAKGDFLTRAITIGNQTINTKWYTPKTVTNGDATLFVTAQTGSFISRQCFDLVGGKYVIDTTEIPDVAGFQLLKTDTAVGNTIKPPKAPEGIKPPAMPSAPKP